MMRELKFMGNGRLAGRGRINPPKRQRGVVLLITLIVLVAMMLAGIGMMRSVDTTTMIAGNVAFREATLHAGDAGMNAAFAMLLPIGSNPNDKQILNFSDNTSPAIPPAPGLAPVAVCPGTFSPNLCTGNVVTLPGYRSTPLKACEVYPPGSPNGKSCAAADYQWWTQSANWNGAPSIPVKDANNNLIATVYYWIHRMCEVPDVAPDGALQNCQTIQESVNTTGSSMQVGTTKFTSTSVYYRVTTKAVGFRNTVTYAQELILIPE